MKTVPKSAFWIIFFIVFIDLIGFGIVFPLLPLYVRHFQVSEWEFGWTIGVYSLMQFVFAPLLGQLSDKIGRRPVLLVSMLGTALSFLMLAWANNFWWFFVARALDGIAGSNFATAQAYIADISPREQRTRNLGMWIGAAFGLGFAFGPFIGGGLHWLGQYVLHLPNAMSFPFLVAGVISLINWGLAWFKLPESLTVRDSEHLIGRRTFSLKRILSHLSGPIGWLIVAYSLVILAFAQMESTFSWLAQDRYHFSDQSIYIIFGYLGLVMAFVQGGLIRRLAPRLGDKVLAVAGCILMIAGLLLLPALSGWTGILVASGLLAVGESFAQPTLISGISKATRESVQGETLGVAQSLASLSRFVGPVAAGYAYQHYGFTSPYAVAAVLMLLGVGLCIVGFNRLPRQTETLS